MPEASVAVPASNPPAPHPADVAFAALDAAGVHWAVIRDDPHSADASDVDLIVASPDIGRLDHVLAEALFGRVPTWSHGRHRFFFAYDGNVDRWTKLDVVDRLAYRAGTELPPSMVPAVLGRRVRARAHWRLHPDDEFWALLLHCLLDRGEIPSRHLARLRDLAEDDPGGPLRSAVGDLATAAIADARANRIDALVALRHQLAESVGRPTLVARLDSGFRALAAPMAKAVLGAGIGVAVLGPDGAGKSTLVQSLPGTLPMQVRTYYGGMYGNRLRALRSTGVPGVALVSQLAVSWATYVAAAYQRRRGRITLFDRYGYDALLEADNGRSGVKRRLRGMLLGRLAPRPDLVLVLVAKAETLHHRKGEHDPEAIARRRSAYLRLAQQLGTRMRVELIDSTEERSAVRRKATLLIWQALRERSRLTGPSHRGAYGHAPRRDEATAHGDR